jgi:hypothetical protein
LAWQPPVLDSCFKIVFSYGPQAWFGVGIDTMIGQVQIADEASLCPSFGELGQWA